MCGIIGAVAQRDIVEILLKGLYSLEYRGYDSSGLIVVNKYGHVHRLRCVGKVKKLEDALKKNKLYGISGIAHTRWATHGIPSEMNAHPHISDFITVVHNGIIENYEQLREILIKRGYYFDSSTDTEVIAHLINWEFKKNKTLLEVVQSIIPQLYGSYSIVIMDYRNPDILVGVCSGSPLVIGLGIGENFIASDQLALLQVTKRFIFLKENDLVQITRYTVNIFDKIGNIVERPEIESKIQNNDYEKGTYCHYMQKEIYEQPSALFNTIEGRIIHNTINFKEFTLSDNKLLSQVKHIKIIACGTSYHSGMVARYWFESLASISCEVEIASEFRYRKSIVRSDTLIITLSQSGETADTLAALRLSKKLGYLGSLTICNVDHSSLVRESDLVLMTKAGIEIGVASTKSFTTQLAVLLMIVVRLGRINGMSKNIEYNILKALQSLPSRIEEILSIDSKISILAKNFIKTQYILCLGRGDQYPIAMEGALKLKEISYINAEAYAAGELKHGPLALIDSNIPVIVIAPKNKLLEKLKSNIEEVYTRGGILYIFTDKNSGFIKKNGMTIISLPNIEESIAPIIYSIPLQLLSYHIALIKGTDIDQPRNLAKSVTVE